MPSWPVFTIPAHGAFFAIALLYTIALCLKLLAFLDGADSVRLGNFSLSQESQ